ncbi:MAG: hypothetical protein ABH884_03730 [Candidatus Komeilibacteria bacterium]
MSFKNTFLLVLVLFLFGTVGLYFYNSNHLRNLTEEQSKTLENVQIDIKSTPIAVGMGMGTDWFETWANENDIIVFFGEDFSKIPEPDIGKVGWNTPSFNKVIETENQWQGKLDAILYDYEMWDKTSQEEKNDPDWAVKRAQNFANERNMLLIQGSSWKMVTERDRSGETFFGIIKVETLQSIARNVDNYGFNAVGLRKESPQDYIKWFIQCSNYAREVNPNIKMWFMLDARNQTADEMYDMFLEVNKDVEISGISIMGTRQDQKTVEELISKLRS